MLEADSDETQNNEMAHMPNELGEFVQRDTYSLLIKGFAGTGKTTLALTILKVLRIRDNFFYISTRISPKQLFQYYPWLSKFIGQPRGEELGENLDNAGKVSSFEDARLDEPESLFERITNQLMDVKSPVIIIDSWDAIASFMDKEARLNNERVLQTWRERAGAKLIFISEHPDDSTLDFLVDGIVELKQNYYDSARVREIFLLKLRGVQINRPSYIYSLNHSIFKSYMPYRLMDGVERSKKKDRRKNGAREQTMNSDRFIGSGYATLDIALGGGFPRKGIVLLELDPHVNTRLAIAFLSGLISNFIAQANPVIFQAFEWIDPDSVIDYLAPYLSTEPKPNIFKILGTTKQVKKASKYVVPISKGTDTTNKIKILGRLVLNLKENHRNKMILSIVGTNATQPPLVSDLKRNEAELLLSGTRSIADISVIVTRHSHNMLERIAEVSDVHVKLMIIKGTLFLQSLVPWSSLYAISFENSDGRINLSLDPIV